MAHSDTTLVTLSQQIVDQAASVLSALGATIVWAGPDPSSNTVQVALSNYTPVLAQAIVGMFGGPNLISVVQAPGGSLQPVSVNSNPVNRYHDDAPYSNGDRIRMEQVNPATGASYKQLCTAAFALAGSSTTISTTDGHCHGQPDDVWDNLGPAFGTVKRNYWEHANRSAASDEDLEKITCNCSTQGFVYTEPPNAPAHKKLVVDATALNEQQSVAYDGASTGEVDDQRIVSPNNACVLGVFFGDGRVRCGLTETVSNTGQTPAARGDSGGPVFQNVGTEGNVDAVGAVISCSLFQGETDCFYMDLLGPDGIEQVTGGVLYVGHR